MEVSTVVMQHIRKFLRRRVEMESLFQIWHFVLLTLALLRVDIWTSELEAVYRHSVIVILVFHSVKMASFHHLIASRDSEAVDKGRRFCRQLQQNLSADRLLRWNQHGTIE